MFKAFRSRFFWSLFAGYCALAAVALVLAGILLGLAQARQVRQETLSKARSHAVGLSAVYRDRSPDGGTPGILQAELESLRIDPGIQYALLDVSGAVVAQTLALYTPGRNMDQPELRDARDKGSAQDIRLTPQGEWVYSAVALTALPDVGQTAGAEKRLGFAVAATAVDGDALQTGGFLVQAGIAGLLAFIVLLVPAAALALRRSAPILELAEAAQAIAAGESETVPRIFGSDPTVRLAASVNTIASTSRDRIDTIARERNQLAAVLSGMVEGVIAIDREERVVHMNRAAGRLFGLDATDCIGRRIYECVRVPALVETFSATLSGGQATSGELRLPESKRDIELEMYAAPLLDSGGESAGAVMVLHNITELRRLEGVRRDFVGNVSHELKTPLTAIRGFVETLLDDERMDAETARRFLGRINVQTQRLTALVSDLLTLSRIESQGHEQLELRPLDLREVARECERAIAPSAELAGVALTMQLPAEPAPVLGDRESLRQAIGNLLDNAAKYTAAGGAVALTLSTSSGRALLSVTDSGIGIEPAEQERIFERFYRVDKARSRELGGTGLGLSIVKHICLAHGGSVSVSSAPGSGSTFTIDLPLLNGANHRGEPG